MKKLTLITTVILSTFILNITSCKNDDDTVRDCGCESKTQTTIPKLTAVEGRIFFKTQTHPLDDFYNNTYWIGYKNHRMIICNTDELLEEFNDLEVSGELVEIYFSGHLKETCEKKFDIAENTYHRILLTSIQRQ